MTVEPADAEPELPTSMQYFSARRGLQLVDLGELWQFRELIWAFGLRDLKIRYRQTLVGMAWAVLQPLCTVAVFALVIHWLQGRATTGDTPYFVTALCGIVPWQFFAASVSQSTQSISANNSLLKKVYFPRLALPLSSFVPAAADFLLACVVLALVMVGYGVWPTWKVVFLPLAMLLLLACTLSVALWLSALNAIYRDVQFVVPFALQIGMMLSPVVYDTEAAVPEQWRELYFLNPIAVVIQMFRFAILDSPLPSAFQIGLSMLSLALVALFGSVYFRRMERLFADRS